MTDEIHASFWKHLEELRAILIRSSFVIFLGVLVALYYQEKVLQFLLPTQELFLFSPADAFISIFKLSFWLGFLGTSPYWLGGILRFIQPALRGKARMELPGFFLLSGVFIASALGICHCLTLPLAISYFHSFNQAYGINMWGFSAYIDFTLMLLFAHGAAFEVGALLIFLVHKGIIPWHYLIKKRRHSIVASLIIGAALTPPDVLTQLCVALPLMGFYELAILYGRHITHLTQKRLARNGSFEL